MRVDNGGRVDFDDSPRAPPLKQNPIIQYSKPYNTVLINVVGHGMATGPEETGRNQPFYFFSTMVN